MVPTHTELMRRLGSPERAVRKALDEMRRQGKIVRRNGSGTYIADQQARSRNGGEIVPSTLADSRTIVAIGMPDRSFFDWAMSQLFIMAEAADLSVVCRLLDPATRSLQIPAQGTGQPMGYLLFRHDFHPLAQELQAAGNRVVLVGAPAADTTFSVPNVYSDQQQGGYLATRHLIELGHRSIVFYGYDKLQETRRWRGDERAVREAMKAGNAIKTSFLTMSQALSWNSDGGSAQRYFTEKDAPTAIVAWNDHEALGLLRILNRAGLRVPEDVALVGYDNLPESQMIHPPLTTVDGNVEHQLHAALDILTAPVVPSPAHTVVVLPSFVGRDSSAPVQR
jgi:DNA-binding LacI/PurR family transcriptional regulator